MFKSLNFASNKDDIWVISEIKNGKNLCIDMYRNMPLFTLKQVKRQPKGCFMLIKLSRTSGTH